MHTKPMTVKDFSVGQYVVLESNDPRDNRSNNMEYKISKVGREWVEVCGHRFKPETMLYEAKGYGVRGRVWMSAQDYEQNRKREQAWETLKKTIRDMHWHNVPEHLSTEEIEAITSRLSCITQPPVPNTTTPTGPAQNPQEQATLIPTEGVYQTPITATITKKTPKRIYVEVRNSISIKSMIFDRETGKAACQYSKEFPCYRLIVEIK